MAPPHRPASTERGARAERPQAHQVRVLLLIALGALPLLLLAAANLVRQVTEGEARVSQERIALARAAGVTVSGFLNTSLATLQTLSETPTVGDPTPRAELTDLLRQARHTNSPLEVIGLYRPDGWNTALAGFDRPPFTVNVTDREYVQRARASGRPVISPATIPRATGVLTVDLVVPVDFRTGGRGVLAGSLALTRLAEQLQALPGSDSVRIVVVDEAGQAVLHPDLSGPPRLVSLKGQPAVNAVLTGEAGTQRSQFPEGTDALVAYAPVPGYSWGVLVVQPAVTAFGPVERDAAIAVGLLLLALLLVGLLGWFVGGRLSQYSAQLVRAKTHAEGAQARAEAAQRRLALLAEASRLLATSLDDTTVLSRVARLAVPALGDCCAIYLLLEDGSIGRAGLAPPEAPTDGTPRSADGEPPIDPDGPHPVALAIRTAGSLLFASTPDVLLPGLVPAPSCAMVAPLLVGGRAVGALSFARACAPGSPPYGRGDRSLAEDLAHRVGLAVENARLYRAAQGAVQVRDEFLSVAAHELKTPITSLRGYAQLAARRLDDGDGLVDPRHLRKALGVIEVQSLKLAQLVGKLLDLSRIEAGKLVLATEPGDLVPVVSALVERTRLTTDRHSLVLTAPANLPAQVDPLRFEQLVTNLLDNAVKYSPQGGEVEVELRAVGEDAVRLSVRDHGVGIPPEQRRHIFDRFYQAHEGRLRASMVGMGLGLYITRQIVELHGGSIHAESPPDGGTRFVVTLPVGSAPERPAGAGLAAVG